MTQPERNRGRPRKDRPKKLQIDWRRFQCDHANPVAQTYICKPDAPEAKSSKDPTGHLKPGQCFVIYTEETSHGPVEHLFSIKDDRVAVFDRAMAERCAKNLFRSTPEEERFGSLTGANKHILYRNRYYEIWFTTNMGWDRPFIIMDSRHRKVLLDAKGKPRRFYTFAGALKVADQEERKRL